MTAAAVPPPGPSAVPSSVPEVLRRRAAAEPDARAYLFLDESGAERAELTVGALYARVLDVAARLRTRCEVGDRALLLFPPGLDLIVAFLACLHAGVIAVPVDPPRRGRVPDAVRSIVADCAPAAALSVEALVPALASALEPVCGPVHWLAVDRTGPAVDAAPEGSWAADVPAFLQYTSGSTAHPKGVIVTHGNLAANEEMIRRAFGHDRDSTVVGWAPLFHDQGLIGNVLQPLWVGASCVLMSPMTFVRRPLLWLEAISRYRAHTSGGPDFAFAACVARAARGPVPDGLDLRSWRVAFDGAEPVRPTTLEGFAAAFAPHGFAADALHPCYGLAEATLMVTGTGKGRGARLLDADADALAAGVVTPAGSRPGRRLAGSGSVLPGEELRIVDPTTRSPCPPGRVGEVWVAGPHVAAGYWRRPDATRQVFGATLAGDPARWLRTGDLGALVDGELYVVGRLSDVVVVRGRNHHPHDVEQTVRASHPALASGLCAAFGVPAEDGEDGERLVVVAEVGREERSAGDPSLVAAAARAAVVAEHGLTPASLVLTLPGRLERTSSGKIRRAAARRTWQDGGFEAWAPRARNTV